MPMKNLTYLIIMLFFGTQFLFAENVFSQRAKSVFNKSNATINEVIDFIENNSNYVFVFSDNTRQILDKKVDVKVEEGEDIKSLLDKILSDNDLSYRIIGRQIVIFAGTEKQKTSTDSKVQSVQQQSKIFISGIVVEENGEAIIGASVLEKGTTNGILTDVNGNFSLNVSSGAILAISFVGMIAQEVKVPDSATPLRIVLRPSAVTLDDVVIIGYGTVKKRDLTGAVSTIKANDLNVTAAASIGHALQGKAAGLSVIQNSAQPGGGLDILVRGAGSVNASNAPLYIVDGFPIITPTQPGSNETKGSRTDPGTQSILNFINPNDIASIEVLKDASATAIYGARAANGVVLITTKRGSEGRPVVSFTATYAVQKHTDIYDLLHLKEWMDEMNTATWDLWMWTNQIYPYGTNTLENAIRFPLNGVQYKRPYTDQQIEEAGEGTDWLSLVTRDGKIAQYNVSLTGGTLASKYSVSLNYFDHQGIIKNSRMQRYSGRINFDQDIGKYFKSSFSILASRLNNDNTPLGDGQWEKSGLIRAAVQMGPNIPAQLEDGTYPINPEQGTQPNPYSLLQNTDNTIMDRVLANASITAEPIQNLFLKFNVGTDRAIQTRNIYEPKSTLHGGNTNGNAVIYGNGNEQYLTELTANYTFNIGNSHRISALAGYSYEKFKSNSYTLGNNDFLTDAFKWYNLNSGIGTKVVGTSGSENKIASYFGRIHYTLKDRYLLTATLRSDGASVFAQNHKWGYFPSVALGWNMADEEFMTFSKSFLSMLKWRVSYGQTGNADIGSNAFASYYAKPAYVKEDKTNETGVFQQRLENPDLKWETTTELNVGLDVSVLDGKISATFEYYNKVISDLLNLKPLNAYQDLSFVIANVGKTQGRGFEFTLNTRNVSRKDFIWTTDYTFTIYKDRWLERTDDWKPTVYENETDPIRPIYAREATGILQADDPQPTYMPNLRPGQIILADLDGYQRDADGNPIVDANGRFLKTGAPDGIMDDADTRLLGSQDPGFIMGLANRVIYKGIDFNFNFYGMFDRIMEDPTRMAYGYDAWGMAQFGLNRLRSIKNRWLPDNPSTRWPSSFFLGSEYGYGDYFYEKAWFIRLQNVSLGYTLPNTVLSNVLSSCRIHFDVNNVFVITPYNGLDPETDAYPAPYPNARTFTLGIDLKF